VIKINNLTKITIGVGAALVVVILVTIGILIVQNMDKSNAMQENIQTVQSYKQEITDLSYNLEQEKQDKANMQLKVAQLESAIEQLQDASTGFEEPVVVEEPEPVVDPIEAMLKNPSTVTLQYCEDAIDRAEDLEDDADDVVDDLEDDLDDQEDRKDAQTQDLNDALSDGDDYWIGKETRRLDRILDDIDDLKDEIDDAERDYRSAKRKRVLLEKYCKRLEE